MNTPDQPLSPELLDELLSADLDGEFDRAATELGYTPADGAPGADSRAPALAPRSRGHATSSPPVRRSPTSTSGVASPPRSNAIPSDSARRRRAEAHRFRGAGVSSPRSGRPPR